MPQTQSDAGRAEILDELSNQAALLEQRLLSGNSLDIQNIFYFGDSLSDSSTAFANGDVTWDNFDYAGRATNGLVQSQITPYLLGIETVEAHNFAVIGAKTLPESDPAVDFDINFEAQIDRFLDAGFDAATLAQSAATVYIGANDLRDVLLANIFSSPSDLEAAKNEIVSSLLSRIEEQTNRLVEAGFGTVILTGLPSGANFSLSNVVNDTIELLTSPIDGLLSIFGLPGLSDLFDTGDTALGQFKEQTILELNAGIADIAARFEASGAVQTKFVDMDGLFDAVQADFTSFGFSDPTVSYLTIPQVGDFLGGAIEFLGRNPLANGKSADELVWYDPVHPTEKMHKIKAVFQARTLEADATEFLGNTNDNVTASVGDDLIFANGGNDFVNLGDGDDFVFGGEGSDRLDGANGDDIAAGGTGHDTLIGRAGNDVLIGGAGKDNLSGGAGKDLIIGGTGIDKMHGGADDDTFIFANAEDVPSWWQFWLDRSHEYVDGGTGSDSLYLVFDDQRLVDNLQAQIDNGPNWRGEYRFDNIRLTVRNVEEIIVTTEPVDELILRDTQMQARLDEIELWSLV